MIPDIDLSHRMSRMMPDASCTYSKFHDVLWGTSQILMSFLPEEVQIINCFLWV